MKPFKISALVVVSTILAQLTSSSSYALSWNGFCYAQKADGVHCTEIGPSLFPVSRACANWAASIGGVKAGQVRNLDLAALLDQQEANCNYVGDKNKYECFIAQHCDSGNTTHLTGHSVFQLSEAQALTACVDRASQQYLDALKTLTPGCSISVKAVLTLP